MTTTALFSQMQQSHQNEQLTYQQRSFRHHTLGSSTLQDKLRHDGHHLPVPVADGAVASGQEFKLHCYDLWASTAMRHTVECFPCHRGCMGAEERAEGRRMGP